MAQKSFASVAVGCIGCHLSGFSLKRGTDIIMLKEITMTKTLWVFNYTVARDVPPVETKFL